MNEDEILDKVLDLEGPEVSYDPHKSRWGIRQPEWKDGDVAHINRNQAKEFWKKQFHKYGYDKLPFGWAAQLFTAGINIGHERAIKLFQESIGAKPTGRIDDQTVVRAAEAREYSPFNTKLLSYYHTLGERPQYAQYRRGWDNRVSAINQWVTALPEDQQFAKLSSPLRARPELASFGFGMGVIPTAPTTPSRKEETQPRRESPRGNLFVEEIRKALPVTEEDRRIEELDKERARALDRLLRTRDEVEKLLLHPKDVSLDKERAQKHAMGWVLFLMPLMVLAGIATRGAALGILAALAGFTTGLARGRTEAAKLSLRELEERKKDLIDAWRIEYQTYSALASNTKLSLSERLQQIRAAAEQNKNAILSKAPDNVTDWLRTMDPQKRLQVLRSENIGSLFLKNFSKRVQDTIGKGHYGVEEEQAIRLQIAEDIVRERFPGLIDRDPDGYKAVVYDLVVRGLDSLPAGSLASSLSFLPTKYRISLASNLLKSEGKLPDPSHPDDPYFPFRDRVKELRSMYKQLHDSYGKQLDQYIVPEHTKRIPTEEEVTTAPEAPAPEATELPSSRREEPTTTKEEEGEEETEETTTATPASTQRKKTMEALRSDLQRIINESIDVEDLPEPTLEP